MFDEVCRDYFPRWRGSIHWQVRVESRGQWVDAQGKMQYTTEAGYCDKDNRTILLKCPSKANLIHEICHAVAGLGHGKRFWTRMRKAVQRAEELGEAELAGELRQQADACESDLVPNTAASVYRKADEVVSSVPEITFDALVEYLADEMGMTSTEVRQRYRRLQHVYETAQNEWLC